MIITPQGIEDHQQYEKTEVDIVEQNFKKTFSQTLLRTNVFYHPIIPPFSFPLLYI